MPCVWHGTQHVKDPMVEDVIFLNNVILLSSIWFASRRVCPSSGIAVYTQPALLASYAELLHP